MQPTVLRLTEADLRMKTDRQLLLLASHEIARARQCAASSELTEAEAKYMSARLLLAAAQSPSEESAELAAQLESIRMTLPHPGGSLAA
jgi:hypothetical protein